MPFIHDLVPIDEDFERAGALLMGGGSAWVTGPAAAAFDRSDDVTVELQAARGVEHGDVVIPKCWAATTGPFAILDADLRLEAIPPSRSQLSLSASYRALSSKADGGHFANGLRLTERRVRRFLVGVAITLERDRTGPR